MVWSRKVGLLLLSVALLNTPMVGAHAGGHDDADTVHALQDELIADWLMDTRLATPEEAEALVAELGYPQEPDPTERFTDYVVREDLTTAGDLDGAMRVMRFAHITDLQLVDDDAPYPIRQALLDEFFAATISGGAERPQEEYSDEILHSLVDIVNVHHALDPLDFAIHTGDNIDNALENELMRYIDIVKGTHTTKGPISGFECLPDGQAESVDDDSNNVEDSCTSLPEHLVPHLRGLADDLPWYSLYGNHDGLIQGNVPVEPSFQEAAGEFGRHFLHQDDYVRMHFDNLDPCLGGTAEDHFGHGYGFADRERLCDDDVENDAYYAFDHQGVRFIILDTVNDEVYQTNPLLAGVLPTESQTGHDFVSGLSEGAIDANQWDWLIGELDAASDRPVFLAAHHTITAFYSDHFDPACGAPGCAEDLLRLAGFRGRDDMKELIGQYPNIVAFIGGHTHQHSVNAEVGGLYGDHPGYWNIETSGLLDLPQESRIVEVWVTADGTKGVFALDPIGHQFELAKELAATDPDHDADAAAGKPEDQRVLLWFDVPAGQLLFGEQPPGQTVGNITVSIIEPDAHGEKAHIHDTGVHNVTVTLTDGEGEPVEAVTVSFGVTAIAPFDEEAEVVVNQVFEPMDILGNGTHRTTYDFSHEGVYRVGFFLQDEEGTDLGTTYFDIEVGERPKERAGIPVVALPFLLAGMALAFLGARRTNL